jgi:co-chaperonin GroES (HSP10)
MNIDLLHDRVFVKPDPKKDNHAGFEIVESSRPHSTTGVVIASGPDTELKKDDKVLFLAGTGTEITYDGYEVLLMTVKDILGTIKA